MGRRIRTAPCRVRRGGGTLKLLDITEFYSPLGGGVQTYLRAKADWLSRNSEIDHVIVVPGERDGVGTIAASRMHVVKGPRVPASPGYRFLTAGRRVRQIVHSEQPNVIEVGSPFFATRWARQAARQTGTPLVGFLHCDARQVYVDHGLRRLPPFIRARVGRALERYLRSVYGDFDATVAASPAAARALHNIGVEAVTEVPLAVDTHLFRPERRDSSWRAEVGATPEQPIALYVGRLATEKRLDVVLDALPELHSETGLKLVLIGEGHLRARFSAFAADHPAMLVVLDYEKDRSRLARAFASADLYIAPFPYETFGLAALEAMASGLPVIGVDAGGIADLLTGTAFGSTYRPGNSSDLIGRTREFLSNDLAVLGAQAREATVQRYSWDRTFRELEQLYRAVDLGKSNRTPTAATATNSVTSLPSW